MTKLRVARQAPDENYAVDLRPWCYSSSSSIGASAGSSTGRRLARRPWMRSLHPRAWSAHRYRPSGTPLDPTCRHVAKDAVVDSEHARDLVQRPGLTGELQQVVDALALVLYLVRELAPPPHVVHVPRASGLLDQLAGARHDLALAVFLQVRVEQQQNLVLGHRFPCLLPSVWSASPLLTPPGTGGRCEAGSRGMVAAGRLLLDD